MSSDGTGFRLACAAVTETLHVITDGGARMFDHLGDETAAAVYLERLHGALDELLPDLQDRDLMLETVAALAFVACLSMRTHVTFADHLRLMNAAVRADEELPEWQPATPEQMFAFLRTITYPIARVE